MSQRWMAVPRLILVALTALGETNAGAGTRLHVEIHPFYGSQPLSFGLKSYATANGQEVSITRLDYLVSGLALHQSAGQWVSASNQVAYISSSIGRTGFDVEGFPAGDYDRIRFHVGLEREQDARSPSDYPAGHPLNPEVNHLYWGWRGGYVFLALEGHWGPAGAAGFSWHLATENELMTVELPLALRLSGNQQASLTFDVAQIFSPPFGMTLNEVSQSTHSRPGDTTARRLAKKIEQAFAVESVTKGREPMSQTLANQQPAAIGPSATPYSLRVSRFFPRPNLPVDNPLTQEGVDLGCRLFFDPRLSANNSQSCASCHEPDRAFSQNTSVSTGAEGKQGRRNTMALLNLAWKNSFFWDGRASSLRQQVLQPIQAPLEMHETLSNVVAKLGNAAPGDDLDYAALFERAFGSRRITADRLARALEQFLLTQTSFESKFDRVLKGQARFTAQEQRGFELFNTEYDPRRQQFGADCFHCHGGPLFRSQDFANNGLEARSADAGRFEVTGNESDRGKFAVPSLRNVELTAPYMHDGRFATLKQAVEHYRSGVVRSATLDPNLAKHPDGGVPLSDADIDALVAFLKTLTDDSLRQPGLVSSDREAKQPPRVSVALSHETPAPSQARSPQEQTVSE